jgi:hypothetical protein
MGNGIHLPMKTSTLPRDYVNYLCNPGLKTRSGVVPLQMYMGAHKNGGKSKEFLDALFKAKLADLDDPTWTPASCVPGDELAIMVKGQGNDEYYVKLWDWIWDNQEQLGSSSSDVLQNVYQKYFVRKEGGPNGIVGMIKDAYFGNECIGFVSNYLRYINVWDKYFGVDNHKWKIHFGQKVQRLQDVKPLDLLEWTNVGHVALVDQVYGMVGNRLRIDFSQCSGMGDLKGPMSNQAFLSPVAPKKDDDGNVIPPVDGQTLFEITGTIPVLGFLNVRRMAGLEYSGVKPDGYRERPLLSTG